MRRVANAVFYAESAQLQKDEAAPSKSPAAASPIVARRPSCISIGSNDCNNLVTNGGYAAIGFASLIPGMTDSYQS
jgi:hypothetical protein